MNISKCKKLLLIAPALFFAGLVWFLSYSEVNNDLTAEDSRYTSLFLKDVKPLPETPDYHDEIKFISSVQRSVLGIAPQTKAGPIANRLEREPENLYLTRSGYCYDRSRTIEKILRLHGFKARHIYMISTVESGSLLKSLLTKGVDSHAVTEVLTQKGWLVVGSNSGWISVDKSGLPLSIKELKYRVDHSLPLELAGYSKEKIYYSPFGYIYGLYSRHGEFYPPFNSVPDVNYAELMQNF